MLLKATNASMKELRKAVNIHMNRFTKSVTNWEKISTKTAFRDPVMGTLAAFVNNFLTVQYKKLYKPFKQNGILSETTSCF